MTTRRGAHHCDPEVVQPRHSCVIDSGRVNKFINKAINIKNYFIWVRFWQNISRGSATAVTTSLFYFLNNSVKVDRISRLLVLTSARMSVRTQLLCFAPHLNNVYTTSSHLKVINFSNIPLLNIT